MQPSPGAAPPGAAPPGAAAVRGTPPRAPPAGGFRGSPQRLLAIAIVLAPALGAWATRSVAEDDAGEVPVGLLDEVVVTARRSEAEVFDVPYTADVIDGEAASDRKAARNLPDALREVPGVMVQKTSTGQASPYIRGFTGFRTLLLIDGIRLNNAVFRDGPNQYWNTVDILTVDRLEVVKGPSSVLHGSDAIGGTVNAITRSRDLDAPRDGASRGGFSAGEFHINPGIYGRIASAERSAIGRAEISGDYGGKVGIVGGLTCKDYGDFLAGRDTGELPNTAHDELHGDLKVTYRPRSDLELTLAYQHGSLDDVPRTHATIHSKSFHGTTIGTDLRRDYDQERDLAYGQLRWRDLADWLSRLTLSISFQSQREDEVRVRSDGRRTDQGFDDGTLGAWVQLETPSAVGTWTYGVELYHDDVRSWRRDTSADGTVVTAAPRGPVADDSIYDQVGAYVEDRVELARWVELTIGGRFNYAYASASEVDPDPAADPDFEGVRESYHALVGSARVLFRPLEDWNIFGGASQGFRAPNLSDLTRFDVSRSGEIEIPAPDLDPERYLTLEAGTKWRHPEWGLEAFASYHYTFIDDMIVRFPTGDTIDDQPVVTKDNVGDGYVTGVELGLSWSFYEGFTVFGSLAWVRGSVDNYDGGVRSREPFSRIQPTMSLLGLRWDSRCRRYWVETTVEIADGQSRLSPEDARDTQRIPPGGTPGYTIYAIRGGVEPKEGLRLFAGVENFTGKDYRIHGSGQNEVGTNAIVGLHWTY